MYRFERDGGDRFGHLDLERGVGGKGGGNPGGSAGAFGIGNRAGISEFVLGVVDMVFGGIENLHDLYSSASKP